VLWYQNSKSGVNYFVNGSYKFYVCTYIIYVYKIFDIYVRVSFIEHVYFFTELFSFTEYWYKDTRLRLTHRGIYHCCTFCSSGGKKEMTCGCRGTMPGKN